MRHGRAPFATRWNRIAIACQFPVRCGDSEQLVIELLSRVRRAMRNRHAGSDVGLWQITQEVVPCSSAIFASRDCSSSALLWQRRARRKRKSQEAGTAALQLPHRTRRLRRARPLPRMLRPLLILRRHTPRQRHMSPPRASPRRTRRPLHTSLRRGTHLRKLPHRATRRRALPRHMPHPLHASLRRATQPRTPAPRARHKRLARRRGRLRIPHPVRAALSPRPLRRIAAATPGRGKTRRRSPTRLHDKV